MPTTINDLPNAVTNTEHYLAAMAGTESTNNLPAPVTNTDKYLDYIARNGGESETSESWITSIPQMHRNIFRGKSLGSEVTAAQLAAIDDASFDDLYVGDYWTINGVNWRIADMDRYYGLGDTALTKHHLVIVPDEPLLDSYFERNYEYYGSDFRNSSSSGLASAKTIVNAAFPGMVLTYRQKFETISGSMDNPWTDADIELMNQILVLGHRIHIYSTSQLDLCLDLVQLALFELAPQYIKASSDYWLRDPCNRAPYFSPVILNDGSLADYGGRTNVDTMAGVRPYFLIGGAEE